MTNPLQRSTSDIIASDDSNVVVVQLAKYGDIREVSDGGPRYRETFQSMRLADKVQVKSSHHGDVIGHADTVSFRDQPEPTVDLHVADTTAGRDLMALVRNGTIGDVSVEFHPSEDDHEVDGVMVRNNSLVSGVAFAFRPAHDAPILATREETNPPVKEETMSDDTTPIPAADAVTREDLDTVLDELKREIVAVQPEVVEASPLAKFRSFGEYAAASWDDKPLQRALFDQITTDNPGVINEGWVRDIKGIVDKGRAVISSFGSTGLPSSGMDISWPYYDGDVATLVAAQATEKTAINSVQLSILKGTEAIATYAGGSDISYQLIRRSDPSYLDAYLRIMAIGYAATTEAAAGAQVVAAATAGTAWNPAGGTADQLRDVLFRASVAIEDATGSPASFGLAATDVYVAIGALTDLYPSNYGTQNVSGTADAASLQVNVSGLPIRHAPYLAAGEFIVSNSSAGAWHEEGPMTVAAEDVELLGQNVAVWGMGVFTPYLPAGIIDIPAA